MAISFSLYGVSTVCVVSRPPFSIFRIPLYARMMFVPLRIFEQTRPCAKELLFHDLDKFVSPFCRTYSSFQRLFVKPSPMFALCFCDDTWTTYLHAVFLQLTWTNVVSLSGQKHAGFQRFFVTPSRMFALCFCDYRLGPYVHAVFLR